FNTATSGEEFLEQNGGIHLCRTHLQLFRTISSAKVAATLLYYLIEKGKALPENLHPTDHCPVCSELTRAENRLVVTYLTEINPTPYEDFVCLQHLKAIIGNPRFAMLTEQEKVYKRYASSLLRLKKQLKAVQDRNYYLLSPEEKNSVLRAVAKLTGRTFIETDNEKP
ncbi:MAG: hypothetical protein ACP5US_09275, partial [Candidatus Kryptoniota bacterium]